MKMKLIFMYTIGSKIIEICSIGQAKFTRLIDFQDCPTATQREGAEPATPQRLTATKRTETALPLAYNSLWGLKESTKNKNPRQVARPTWVDDIR